MPTNISPAIASADVQSTCTVYVVQATVQSCTCSSFQEKKMPKYVFVSENAHALTISIINWYDLITAG